MTYRGLLCLLLVVLLGCSGVAQKPCVTTPAFTPEPLPAPAETTADLPKKTGEPTALEMGAAAPFTGVLLDTYLVGKYKVISAERDRMRAQLLIERHARAQVQAYYDAALGDALKRAERSWWERNGTWVGVAAGVLLTSVLAIGLTYGVREAAGVR
jgi:hypothetical protein